VSGTIAVLGAGRVGLAVARQALASGHEVRIAASGDSRELNHNGGPLAQGLVLEPGHPACAMVIANAQLNRLVHDYLDRA
jgi:predicted dinucleotide-binding enzyme